MRRLSLALLVLCVAVGASGVGEANHACVTYNVTAPVVGNKADTKCSPQSLPPDFTEPIRLRHCEFVPPAGVSACVIVSLHVPPV